MEKKLAESLEYYLAQVDLSLPADRVPQVVWAVRMALLDHGRKSEAEMAELLHAALDASR